MRCGDPRRGVVADVWLRGGGYSSPVDSAQLATAPVILTSVSEQKIYNTLGASLVGPLAKVDAVGVRLQFINSNGKPISLVQPDNPNYRLRAGQHALIVADYGRVWIQPVDYPLPPEFHIEKVKKTTYSPVQ